jgi:UDPglucose--hexose-1-phosphate uridylyltransferase
MSRANPHVRKTTVKLSDGRELMYFGAVPADPAGHPDRRPVMAAAPRSEIRWDWLLGEWVTVASHRQDRTFQPAEDQCPLCPSTPYARTEIPAPDYEVAVFENRFPAFTGDPAAGPGGARPPEAGADLLVSRPATGRCEVICFTAEHAASFAGLGPARAATVMAAWTDRSAELARHPGVRQIYCFENRGTEIGVTLSHPHGQIYACPFVTPRTGRMLTSCAAYRHETGRNLFDDLVAAELADTARIVAAGGHWVAFVPHAAHWPYEVHLYPRRRVPDLPALDDGARAEFYELYRDLLQRFDRLFGQPAPYISAWHQAPTGYGADFALHLELFTVRRARDKLKFLAGAESGMGAFTQDVAPEAAAERLRQLA